MTWSHFFAGETAGVRQYVQKGWWLLLLASGGGLILAFRRQGGMVLGVIVAALFVLVPTVYVLAQRMAAKARQKAIDDRIVMQTRTYLLNWTSHYARTVSNRMEIAADSTGNGLLPVVASKSRMLSSRGFQDFDAQPARPRAGILAVCSALRRAHAGIIPSVRLPHPVLTPLSELLTFTPPQEKIRERRGRRGGPVQAMAN